MARATAISNVYLLYKRTYTHIHSRSQFIAVGAERQGPFSSGKREDRVILLGLIKHQGSFTTGDGAPSLGRSLRELRSLGIQQR